MVNWNLQCWKRRVNVIRERMINWDSMKSSQSSVAGNRIDKRSGNHSQLRQSQSRDRSHQLVVIYFIAEQSEEFNRCFSSVSNYCYLYGQGGLCTSYFILMNVLKNATSLLSTTYYICICLELSSNLIWYTEVTQSSTIQDEKACESSRHSRYLKLS